MKWYKSLPKENKVNVRNAFELATGISLNNALKVFTFSQTMDILYNKLILDGFKIQ